MVANQAGVTSIGRNRPVFGTQITTGIAFFAETGALGQRWLAPLVGAVVGAVSARDFSRATSSPRQPGVNQGFRLIDARILFYYISAT
jgi:hypothetical protein